MTFTNRAAIILAFALGVAAPAYAQATPPAPSSAQGESSDSLSRKLDKANGVITPKGDIDPGMKVPAPAAHPNSMPVIPPAATGGQDAK